MDKELYWLQSLAAGRRGELMVEKALAARLYWVEDKTNDTEYRSRDIDFIVDGTTIEVKNDLKSNYTKNIFVELENSNNIKRGGRGWYWYCEADYMAFVQERYGLAHFVKREELYRIAAAYPIKESDDTRGHIVPIAALRQLPSYGCLEVEKLC